MKSKSWTGRLAKSHFLNKLFFFDFFKQSFKTYFYFKIWLWASLNVQNLIIIHFRKCFFCFKFWFFAFSWNLYIFWGLKPFHFNESLYEASRQWLGWQFTGGPKYRLPGDQTLEFWYFSSICFGWNCHEIVQNSISYSGVYWLMTYEDRMK